MNQKNNKLLTILLVVLCVVLMAVAALFATGVFGGKKAPEAAEQTIAAATLPVQDGDVIGRGQKTFPLTIADKEGNEITVTIRTDKDTVGDALLETGLAEGTMDTYGLYIKKVNGIEAIYEEDQTYWGFYINGEYAMTGVSETQITEGAVYALKVSK